MGTVTIHVAKTHLSRLIERAAAGEEIVILRGKIPVARLIALASKPAKRRFGAYRGEFEVPPSFFDNGGDALFAGANVGYQFSGGADTPLDAYLPLWFLNTLGPIVVVIGARGFIRYHRPD